AEGAVLAGLQRVAPMSRAPSRAACGALEGKAEGIVFALTGISLLADAATFGAANGAARPDCSPDPVVPQGGLTFNKVIHPGSFFGCSGTNDTPANQAAADAQCNSGFVQGEFCELPPGTTVPTAGTCAYRITDWKQVLRILYFGQAGPNPGVLANR